MSSSPPADRRRRWSLRAKLTAQLVVVVAVVCAMITPVTEFALHEFLIGQLDNQLTEASHRAVGGPRDGPQRGGPDGGPINAPGQGPGTFNARIVGNQVTDARRLNRSGDLENLPADTYGVLTSLPMNRALTR